VLLVLLRGCACLALHSIEVNLELLGSYLLSSGA